MDDGYNGGSLSYEEEDDSQRNVLHSLSLHWRFAKYINLFDRIGNLISENKADKSSN